MRVFVTGGAGYIGSHAVLDLLRRGDEVHVFDNFCNSSPRALDRVTELANRPPELTTGDIRDATALAGAMADFRPDAVLHFAGLKAVGESMADPLAYYGINVTGTVNLLRAMQEGGCRRIVFSSSATVYGEAEYLPFDEAHRVLAANPYGRTKAMNEEIIKDWVATQEGGSAVLLRYFNPVGADRSGRIGEEPRGVPNNLMPFVAQVAAGKRQQLQVFGDDYDTRDGTGERDYVHVSDLAAAHAAALDYAGRITGSDVVNVGTGKGTTVLEMIEAFERVTGQKVPYEIVDRRPGDVAIILAEAGKSAEVMGWSARYGLDEMCASLWQWQAENPDGYGDE